MQGHYHSPGFLALVNDSKSRVKQMNIDEYRAMAATGVKHLLVDCGGGYRSALAADALQKMGYTNVISLDGGWKAWQREGLPVAN